jgi:hypothetical protein
MKKVLLLMMMCVVAALQSLAALPPQEWSYTVEVDGVQITYTGKYDITNEKVKIEIDQPGGLAVFLKNNSAALENVTPTKLEIGKPGGCELNADDFKALNSTTYSALSHFTTVDLKETTIESVSTMADMNLSGMEYLRLPSSFDNAPAMKDLQSSSKNTALKMVMSTDETNANLKKVRMYSFVKNNVVAASTALNVNLKQMKSVDMAGYYGENDLYNNGTSANFGEGNNAPAAWDFTGANFAACTIQGANGQNAVGFETPYYNFDDPYQTGATKSGYETYETNAFYYFSTNSNYTNAVASIKLPDLNMTSLPSHSLIRLGATNKQNYLLLHPEMTEAQFNEQFPGENGQASAFAPIEQLVIPNCYTDIDYECAMRSHIQNVVIGSGVKRVHGGAFINSLQLENLDFAPGLSNCYLGDQAFNECTSMKHIALAEGVYSIGASCFWNSQQLESIRLPETLHFIGNDAFRNCLALGNITIPANVEKIGMRAFKLTALRNVYLTTTDPAKVPVIFTGGTSWDDDRSTFSINEMEGYNTIPWNDTNPYTAGLHTMTWDEAIEWYYVHVNCMTILHYPTELADKVKAIISSHYGTRSSDGYGLPIKDGDGDDQANDPSDDRIRRATGEGLVDLGTSGNQGGIWTNDGWVQFLLMKEFNPGEESKVYTKNYKDVWYTMCFPFELTDEQLASAFNEGFNIADFSGIQIKDPNNPDDEVEKMTLVLHFNKVAETLYKDSDKNLYERKRDNDGKVIREKDGSFEYNIYLRNGTEYHHVILAEGDAASTKTKIFAPGSSLADALNHADQALVIDGYLASAGHPYMIHPNTGTVPEADPVPCHFSGITWEVSPDEETQSTDDYRDVLYTNQARTIDLGVANTDNNFEQVAYTSFGEDHKNYSGQTYTFIGNPREYKKGADLSGMPQEPTPPSVPKEPTVVTEPTVVEDPGITLTDNDVTLYSLLTNGKNQYEQGPWINETEITATFNDGSPQASNFNSKYYIYSSILHDMNLDSNNNATEDGFNYCKNLFNNYGKVAAYQQYLIDKAAYDQYLLDKAKYEQDLAAYPSALTAYQTALENYPDDLAAWKATLAAQGGFIVIPQYAYFLGTKKGETYPKYFRERSNDPNRSTGLWTQYSAIIIPNQAAIDGIEQDLDAKTQSASGSKIAFDEPFFFINDSPQGIATLIEKIEKEEGKADVKYMDIVVSIDGKIVSRDKTSIEGLPKGVYIINGKKYYVK